MYKKALKMKLRFATKKGNLSVEDLFDLSLQDLDKIAVALDEEMAKMPKKSFIAEVNPENAIIELRFNIVKDVITTKLAEKAARVDESKKKAEKAKLLEILAKKENQDLENLSVDELRARIAAFDV